MKEFMKLTRMLKTLHISCQREDGSDDQKKGTQLLEVRDALQEMLPVYLTPTNPL
jgi:hypothetical protein